MRAGSLSSSLAIRRYTRPATRTSVADLLAVSKQFRSKQTHYILQDQTLSDAVKYLVKNENSATLVVVNEQHQVVGMLTNQIVLEKLSKMKGKSTKDWTTKVCYRSVIAYGFKQHGVVWLTRMPCRLLRCRTLRSPRATFSTSRQKIRSRTYDQLYLIACACYYLLYAN